jgi:prepilin-type N-terminal cleavage/methylation domain-containing protein
MQRGFTLIEMLMAIMLIGLLAGLALPGLSALRDRLGVESATEAIVVAHTRARLVAVMERRVTVLTLTLDSLVLRAIEAPSDTSPRWRGRGPAFHGVAITGVPRSILFAPSGVTMGAANATYILTRGGARKQIVVSRYGRVRVE